MPDSTTPASQMIRVPTVLIDAVKELSRLHRQGHTRSIIAGLQQLIAAVDSTDSTADSSIDSNIDRSNNTTDSKHDSGLIAQLISEQLESMREQLEQDIQERVHTAIKEEVDTVLGESNA